MNMREPLRDPLPLRWLKGWHVAVATEYFLLAVLLFVPFHFDHAISWGLGYHHFFLVLALLIVFSCGALITCLIERTVWGIVLTALPWFLFYFGLLRV